MIKVGIVGMGGMGKVHYKGFGSIEGTEVVAVADVCPDAARKELKGDNINLYDSLEKMLDNEKLDIVDICTPTYMHREMVEKALSYGAHVLCEKPMAINLEEAEKMLEASRKTDKLFMVCHIIRFYGAYRYLKSVIDSGELGKPLHLSFRRSCRIPSDWELWRHDRSKGGGSLLDLSIHDLDLVQYALGMPEKAYCTYHKMKNENDFVESQLIYPDTVVHLTSGFYSAEVPFVSYYYAVFEKGYISCNNNKVAKNGVPVDLTEERKKEEARGIYLSDIEGHRIELQYFVDCIRQHKRPDIATADSVYDTMRLYNLLLDNCTEV